MNLKQKFSFETKKELLVLLLNYMKIKWDRIGSILNKYSEKEDGPIDDIIDQIEMIRDANKTQL